MFYLNMFCISFDVFYCGTVLDFENNTGLTSQDNLKKALSDSLTNNLAQYKSLSIVERTRLKDAASEVTLSQSSFISADNAIKIGKTLGSNLAIAYSIMEFRTSSLDTNSLVINPTLDRRPLY